MESIKNWMRDAANILFDDSKNDLRALPKTVRLQILLVLSFIWTTVFSLYVFSYTTFAFGWAGLFLAHIGLIFAVYMTFKQFHRAEEKSTSVFQTKNFDPFKIMVIVFVIVIVCSASAPVNPAAVKPLPVTIISLASSLVNVSLP
jgi:4-hydroxybenzoate polyprenyltransferase